MGKALDGANALYQLGQKAYRGAVPAVGVGLATQSQEAEAGPVSVVDDVTGAVKRVIEAWHGSPYKFDKFDMSKIGTGEGAQAYGHGLYAADSKDTAISYKDALAQRGAGGILNRGFIRGVEYPSLGDSEKKALDILQLNDRDMDAAIKSARALRPDDADLHKTLAGMADGSIPYEFRKGNLYRIHINADPDTLLDWDKPLSEQSEAIQDAAARLLAEAKAGTPRGHPNYESVVDLLRGQLDSVSGEDLLREVSGLYHRAGASNPQAMASAELRDLGIPGVRYLDGMSRGAGEGSYNYVVFDDSLMEIKERGFANPELLSYMGAVGGSVAAFGQMRQEKESRWAQLKQEALDMASGAGKGLEFAFNALEMPTRGLHGLAQTIGTMATGGGWENAIRHGAQYAQQPLDTTAQNVGQYVADETGNPYLAAGADAITRVMALEP